MPINYSVRQLCRYYLPFSYNNKVKKEKTTIKLGNNIRKRPRRKEKHSFVQGILAPQRKNTIKKNKFKQ